MALLRQSIWENQPQISVPVNQDWNPSAAWNFAINIETVSGNQLVKTANWSRSIKENVCVSVTGTSGLNRVECASNESAVNFGSSDFTVAVTFIYDGQPGGYGAFGRWNTGATPSSSDWFLGAASTFATATADFTVACGSSTYAASAIGAWVVGNKYTFIGRRRGTTIYVDRYNHTTGIWVSGSTTNAGITSVNYNAARKTKLGEIDAGSVYNIAGSYSVASTFRRCISDAEIKYYADNPWQIFRPIPRRIFAPVSAGGGATIATILGTATSSGYQASISASSPVTITGNIGQAAASGLSATLAQAFTLSANRGTATASGAQATIAQAATISANLGSATASGLTAGISAAGNVTISCNLGTASAAGRQANIGASVTISASRGTATAAGYTAALEIAFTLAANRGTAQATGKTATIYASDVISASMGQAIASGYAAFIVAGEIYARAPSGSGPMLITQNQSRPSNTGGIRR